MADLNQLPVKSAVRQPRSIVRINETETPGWIDWETEENSFYSADTFRVSFAIGKLPAERNADWFSRQQLLYVEIFDGFPADAERYTVDDLTSRIYGRADEIDFDPVSGVITMSGRDFTSVLIDTKSTAQLQNKTASEIATSLAQANGLTPVVTSTSEPVGQYYQIDHVSMQELRSDWDWLTYFAGVVNYRVYVKGKELHFEPTPESLDEYVVQWQQPTADSGSPQANVDQLRFTRSLTVAKGVTVVVRSWGTKSKTGFDVSYPAKAKTIKPGRAQIGNERIVYTFVRGNMTRDQAEKFAEQKHREITQHEYRMEASLPGDAELDRSQLIRVEGTGTSFDTTYYPQVITRTMSLAGGYAMRVLANTRNPEPDIESAG